MHRKALKRIVAASGLLLMLAGCAVYTEPAYVAPARGYVYAPAPAYVYRPHPRGYVRGYATW